MTRTERSRIRGANKRIATISPSGYTRGGYNNNNNRLPSPDNYVYNVISFCTFLLTYYRFLSCRERTRSRGYRGDFLSVI